eukprot:TRINITY_DN3627_c0_g2_i1.p1 TRINITY_DN3627_c0_g2~~TRINITY_DN3627_c0_g2_i1.p1  ORF type:complete len:1072 (+),score=339.67 TRINITY_DN3627_c0_g2_i1:76-3291(+)
MEIDPKEPLRDSKEQLQTELYFLLHQFLKENNLDDVAHKLESQTQIFLDITHAQQLVLDGKFDDALHYLITFLPEKLVNEIRFQLTEAKYYEALVRNDHQAALTIFRNDLVPLIKHIKSIYKKLVNLLGTDVAGVTDQQKVREHAWDRIKKELEANEELRAKLALPNIKEGRLRHIVNQSLNFQRKSCKECSSKMVPVRRTLFHDHTDQDPHVERGKEERAPAKRSVEGDNHQPSKKQKPGLTDELASLALLTHLETQSPTSVQFHPREPAIILVGGQDGSVKIIEMMTGKTMAEDTSYFSGPLSSMKWSPNGTDFAVIGTSKSISILTFAEDRIREKKRISSSHNINDFTWDKQQGLIYGSDDGNLYRIHPDTFAVTKIGGIKGAILSVVATPELVYTTGNSTIIFANGRSISVGENQHQILSRDSRLISMGKRTILDWTNGEKLDLSFLKKQSGIDTFDLIQNILAIRDGDAIRIIDLDTQQVITNLNEVNRTSYRGFSFNSDGSLFAVITARDGNSFVRVYGSPASKNHNIAKKPEPVFRATGNDKRKEQGNGRVSTPDKKEVERRDNEKRESEKRENEKRENDRRENEKRENEKREFEKRETERRENERRENERRENERRENERRESDKKESEKRENEKKEAEKREREKRERERKEREAREKVEKEREQKDREQKEREQRERELRERAEKEAQEKAEREKEAREKAEREQIERERVEKAKAEMSKQQKIDFSAAIISRQTNAQGADIMHHGTGVRTVLFFHNGNGVISIGMDAKVHCWRAQKPGVISQKAIDIDLEPTPGGIDITPVMALTYNDSYLFAACGDSISLWNIRNIKKIANLYGNQKPEYGTHGIPTAIAISRNDNNLCAIGILHDKTVRLYNVTSKEIAEFSDLGERATALILDSEHLIGGSISGTVALWKLPNPVTDKADSCVKVTLVPEPIISFSQHKNKLTQLLVVQKSQLTIIDVEKKGQVLSCMPVAAIAAADHRITSAIFSSTGNQILIGLEDARIMAVTATDDGKIGTDASKVLTVDKGYATSISAHPLNPQQFAFGTSVGRVELAEMRQTK